MYLPPQAYNHNHMLKRTPHDELHVVESPELSSIPRHDPLLYVRLTITILSIFTPTSVMDGISMCACLGSSCFGSAACATSAAATGASSTPSSSVDPCAFFEGTSVDVEKVDQVGRPDVAPGAAGRSPPAMKEDAPTAEADVEACIQRC